MRGRLLLVLGVASVLVAGCAGPASVGTAGSASSSGSSTRSTTTAQAVVTGFVRIYGGPMNPSTGQAAATGAPAPGSQVTIVDAAGHRTTTTSDASGRFTFRLPPGTYRLDCSGETQPLSLLRGTAVEHDCPLDVP